MKIRLSDIPKTGLPVSDALPCQILNERLADGHNHGIVFTEDLKIDLTVNKTPSGAETKGTVTTSFQQLCSRCAESVPRPLSLPTNYYLQARSKDFDADECEDDIGITYYDGDHIDLDELIHETIILSLSIYWCPELKKDGSCSHCDQPVAINTKPNSEKKLQGLALSDLMKKAGIK